METETLVGMKTEVVAVDPADTRELADLVIVTGDQELTSALKAAAERIARDAESEARALCERGGSLRSEAAQAYTAVTEMVGKAEEDARLSALAAEQVADEALRRHLEQIARADESRLQEGLEWVEHAQAKVAAAHDEARTLEREAEAALQRARSRPEVIAWHQITAPFLERIGRARSCRAVSDVMQDVECQGLADGHLRQAAAARTRHLGELAWRTRETVKLWARYAPGGDGMYTRVTVPQTSRFAGGGPGTIFEVSSDSRKVAVHLSEDGCVWVRRKASGPFEARGALVRRIDGRPPSTSADAP